MMLSSVQRRLLTEKKKSKKKSKKDNMPCNKPRRTPKGHSKKFQVKACKDGKEKIVSFGDPKMGHYKQGKKKGSGHGSKKRRKNFKSRHNCGTDPKAKDKFRPKYWSCNWSW